MNKILFIVLLLCSNMLYGQMIRNLQWRNVDEEVTEATLRRGITLYAETEAIRDGEPVTISIWSKCEEADDFIGSFISRVNNNRIAFHWILAYEQEKLPHNEYEIAVNGYTSPQYYFQIQYNSIQSQNSELLDVMVSWRNQIVANATGEPWRDHRITLFLPDGTEFETRTDTEGYVTIENLKAIGMIYFYLQYDTEEKHDVIQPYQEPERPVYYKVKEDDYSLREIAAYDFIYGDSNQWNRLYAANRHNLLDDRNPDLLEVGQALIIPPIGNETRAGTR